MWYIGIQLYYVAIKKGIILLLFDNQIKNLYYLHLLIYS